MSATAGSAITASPNQFGATTRTVAGSGIRLRVRNIPRQQAFCRDEFMIAPPTMHPQPHPGMTPNVHLEDVGTPLGELAGGVRGFRMRRFDRVLVDESVAAVRQRKSKRRNDRGARAQR